MRFWGPYTFFGLLAAAIAAAADQLHKSWTIALLEEQGVRKIVLMPFFDLVLVWNRGISYGLLKQDSDAGRWGLIVFGAAAVLGLIYWLAHTRSRVSAIAVGLVAGGAAGNIADRIHYGAVADFFSFHVGSFQWYIFNLADVAIVAGVAGLLVEPLLASHKSAGKEA